MDILIWLIIFDDPLMQRFAGSRSKLPRIQRDFGTMHRTGWLVQGKGESPGQEVILYMYTIINEQSRLSVPLSVNLTIDRQVGNRRP